MYCIKCGNKNDDGALFCTKCGNSLSAQGINPTPIVKPIPQPAPAVKPIPQPTPAVNPIPQPTPAVKPIPQPMPAVNPIPQPTPAVNPIPQPTPAVKPIPQPTPAVNPIPQPTPAVNPIPQPMPVVNPVPQPNPAVAYGTVQTKQKNGTFWANFLGYFLLWCSAIINFGGGIYIMIGGLYVGMSQAVYATYPELKGLDIIYGIICEAIAVFTIICAVSIIKRKKNAIIFVPALYAVSIVATLIYNTLGSLILKTSCFTPSVFGSIFGSGIMIVVNYIYFKNRSHIFVN